jgi:nucleoside-diphosphate-sugar epimerase
LSGENPFVVWGSSDVTRDFMYVKDMIKGCLLVLEKGESMKPYNVGSGTGVTIGELVKAVVKSSDNNPTIEWDNSKPTTIPYKVSSIERLQNELDFKPDYTFEQGIKETMEWYENL